MNQPVIVGTMAGYSQGFGPNISRKFDMGTHVATSVQQGAQAFRCVRVADDAPVLGGLLAGLGAAWTALYGLLGLVRLQSRLVTVTEQFLDLACTDYFGTRLARRTGETDATLRARLMRAMRRERGTRAGLIAAAAEAGYSATIFEFARPADTGAYSTPGGLAWNVAGGWGSLELPFACLITATAETPVTDVRPELAAALPAGGVAWVRLTG